MTSQQVSIECTHVFCLDGNHDFSVLHMTIRVSTRVFPCRLSRGETRFSCFTHDEPGQHSSVPMPSVSRGNKIFLFYTWRAGSALECPHAVFLEGKSRFSCFTHDELGSTRVFPCRPSHGVIKIFLFCTWRARSALVCTHAVCLPGNQDFPVLHMAHSDFKPAYRPTMQVM